MHVPIRISSWLSRIDVSLKLRNKLLGRAEWEIPWVIKRKKEKKIQGVDVDALGFSLCDTMVMIAFAFFTK